MKDLLLSLKEIGPGKVDLVGGKGANLAELALGLTVPGAFCLTTKAYRQHLVQEGVNDRIIQLVKGLATADMTQIDQTSIQIRELIMGLKIPAEVCQAIDYAHQRMQEDSPQAFLAVRSSATAEDQQDASFAGQQESYLNIEGLDNLRQAVKKCWASLWTPQAIHYRFLKGYNQEQVEMAVIIQAMVQAEFSGVMFTANPVNNSRQEILIEAAHGLGEDLVSGVVTGQRYIIAKEGLKIITKPLEEATAILPDSSLRQLALFGVRIEEYYKEFQDIEWAFYKGQFYFLQSRPITTLGDEPPQPLNWGELNPVQKEVAQWVAERFPEPIYPLDGIVAKTYFMANFRAMESLGYNVPEVDWCKVESGIFPEYFIPPVITRNYKQIFNFFRLPKTLSANPAEEWQHQQKNMLKIVDRMKTVDLNIYPPNILFEYLEDALADFYAFVIWRYQYFIKNRLPSDLLTSLLKLLYGADSTKFQEDLLSGIPCITLEINNQLEDFARKTMEYPEVAQFIREETYPDFETIEALPGGQIFLSEMRAFLAAYGARETSMGLGGLANPTWQEAPEVVWGILRGLLTVVNCLSKPGQNTQIRQKEAEKRLAITLSQGLWALIPIKPLVFALVKQNRNFAIFRENSHYHITEGLNIIKSLFLEIGNRFIRLGLLARERDIIYLSYFELKDLIYKTYNYQKVDKEAVKALIETRKKKQDKRINQWESHKALAKAPFKGGLQGVPASAGVVKGPVRIIMNPGEFHRVRKGDILVAPYTNPAWTPLFATVAGLVVDTGGAASHAAIIAREYEVPAVMGVGNATALLKEGEIVIVNGSTGQVQKESSS